MASRIRWCYMAANISCARWLWYMAASNKAVLYYCKDQLCAWRHGQLCYVVARVGVPHGFKELCYKTADQLWYMAISINCATVHGYGTVHGLNDKMMHIQNVPSLNIPLSKSPITKCPTLKTSHALNVPQLKTSHSQNVPSLNVPRH
jgi:hypothetical protein